MTHFIAALRSYDIFQDLAESKQTHSKIEPIVDFKMIMQNNAIVVESEFILNGPKTPFPDSFSKQQETQLNQQPKVSKWSQKQTKLASGFHPGLFDVICARGTKAWNHPGNRYFRSLVQMTTERYSRVTSREQRSIIVTEIVNTIRSKGNGFVKEYNQDQWVEVGDNLAREKVGQMFRNALHGQYKSSSRVKKGRRREIATQLHKSLHKVMTSNREISKKMDNLKQALIKASSDSDRLLSDNDVLAIFNRGNTQMLRLIKEDNSLIQRFHDVESSTEKNANE